VVSVVLLAVGLVATMVGVAGMMVNSELFSDGTPKVQGAPVTLPTGEVVFNDRMSLYRAPADSYALDESTQTVFVADEIMVMFKQDVTPRVAAQVIAGWGGKAVGHLTAINRYEVKLAQKRSLDDLNRYAATLQKDARVEVAYVNNLQVNDKAYEPSDPTQTNPATQSGTGVKGDWGWEAIHASALWDLKDEVIANLDRVRVGILDGGFAENSDTPVDVLAPNDSTEDHGTHVAGIIGASFDNGDGAAGVVPSSSEHRLRMFGVAQNALDVSTLGASSLTDNVKAIYDQQTCLPLSAVEFGLVYLVAERHTRVVNYSWGASKSKGMAYAASRGNAAAIGWYADQARPIMHVMGRLLTAQDFLMVSSAGNMRKKMSFWTCAGQNFKDCPLFVKDDNEPYGYKFASWYDRIWGGNGGFDAAYNSEFTFIGSEFDKRSEPSEAKLAAEIRAHVLVVGAVGKSGSSYALADFSNEGSRVDLYAPGVYIDSTVGSAADSSSLKHRCGSVMCKPESGTSMSAPFVSGSAAALWAMDPGLTALQVRDRIMNSRQEAGSACPGTCLLDVGAAATKLHDDLQSASSGSPGLPTLVSDSATNTAIVIDNSGSMADASGRTRTVTDSYGETNEETISKLEAAQEASKVLLQTIRSTASRSSGSFSVGVSAFSDSSTVVSGLTDKYLDVDTAISGLSSGGGTNLVAAIEAGMSQLASANGASASASGANAGTNLMILLSDGQDTDGNSSDAILAEASQAASAGVKICTIGFGEPGDLDEDLLKTIASRTGCRYSYADSASSVALSGSFISAQLRGTQQVLGEQTGTVGSGAASQSIPLTVPNETGELTAVLYAPDGNVDVVLTDAKGKVVDAKYAGVTIDDSQMPAQIVITDPAKGSWTLAVRGSRAANGPQAYYAVAAFKPIERDYTVKPVPALSVDQPAPAPIPPTATQVAEAVALGVGPVLMGAGITMLLFRRRRTLDA
jgi:hypothetical protein